MITRFSSGDPVYGPFEPLFKVCTDEIVDSRKLLKVTKAQSAYAAKASGVAELGLVGFLRSVGHWQTITQRLCYTSNDLAGNPLTERQVIALLRDKNEVRDHKRLLSEPQDNILAHAQGMELVAALAHHGGRVAAEVQSSVKPLTTSDLRELHRVSIPLSPYNKPGNWRTETRSIASTTPDGAECVLSFPWPSVAAEETMELIQWIGKNEGALHPVALATVAHYNLVRARPFGVGNGRMGRLLMNVLLLRGGYFPSIIRLEDEPRYMAALRAADHGRTLTPLASVVVDGVLRCMSECKLK